MSIPSPSIRGKTASDQWQDPIPPAGLLFTSASLGQHSLSKVCSSNNEESIVFQDGKSEIIVSGWVVPIMRRAWSHSSFLHWSYFSTVASTGKWLSFSALGILSEENQIGKKMFFKAAVNYYRERMLACSLGKERLGDQTSGILLPTLHRGASYCFLLSIR